jgi:hypothetical protein
MHDHDEHNRGKPHDQPILSVLKAISKSVAQFQFSQQPLKKHASRKGSQPLILEAKLWDRLDGAVKL